MRLFTWIAVTFLLNVAFDVYGFDDLQKGRVDHAWRQRMRRLESGQIDWSERVLFVRGSQTGPEDKGRIVPERDEFVPAERRLIWQNNKMRYSYETFALSINRREFAKATYESVCGGRGGSRELIINLSNEYPRGVVFNKEALSCNEDAELIPLLMWMRPSDHFGYTIDPTTCQFTEEVADDGQKQLIMTRPRSNGLIIDKFYLDPKTDYNITQYEVLLRKRVCMQFKIEYEIIDAMAVPSSWKVVVLDNQGRVTTEHVANRKAIFLNKQFDERVFELDFPKGTWVRDHAADENYIVTPGGGKRPIEHDEVFRNATYKELLASEPGQARLTRPSSWSDWKSWLLCFSALSFMACVISVVRSRSRAR